MGEQCCQQCVTCPVACLCFNQNPNHLVWHRVLQLDRAYVLTGLRASKVRGHRYRVWTTGPSSQLMPLKPDCVQELELEESLLEPDPQAYSMSSSSQDSSSQDSERQRDLDRDSKLLHYEVRVKGRCGNSWGQMLWVSEADRNSF